MAQMERFELSHRLSQSTPLAGEPLEPLGYICICCLTSPVAQAKLAEREGFEPPVPFDITGFQDQRLKPLGHLSTGQSQRQAPCLAAQQSRAITVTRWANPTSAGTSNTHFSTVCTVRQPSNWTFPKLFVPACGKKAKIHPNPCKRRAPLL